MHSTHNYKHIAVIGADGKVGRALLGNIVMGHPQPDLRFTLIARNTESLGGTLTDLACTLSPQAAQQYRRSHFVMTDRIEQIKNAGIVVVLASLWPTPEQKAAFQIADPSGRLGASFLNYKLMGQVGAAIQALGTNPLTLVVTNQADMMAARLRDFLPPDRVLGFGGSLDTARYRFAASRVFGGTTASKVKIVGYHNDDMIPLMDSLPKILHQPQYAKKLTAILQATRDCASMIARRQANPDHPEINSGPAFGPGRELYRAIIALSGGMMCANAFSDTERAKRRVIAPYNIMLSDRIDQAYGVPEGTALSVPVSLHYRGVSAETSLAVTPSEQAHLAAAAARLGETYRSVAAFHAKPPDADHPTP